jgi:hypothetical protein
MLKSRVEHGKADEYKHKSVRDESEGNEMTIQPDLFAQAILTLWLLGFIHLWNETAPRTDHPEPPARHWRDMSEDERIEEWLRDE